MCVCVCLFFFVSFFFLGSLMFGSPLMGITSIGAAPTLWLLFCGVVLALTGVMLYFLQSKTGKQQKIGFCGSLVDHCSLI